MHAKNTHPSCPSARKNGDTEPPGGKRGKEEGEKPIGRIGERGEKRELSLPAYRKGNDAVRKTVTSRPVKPNRGCGTADLIESSDAAARENGTSGGEIWER